MFESIFWANAAAIVTGMIIYGFAAGVLSELTKQQWKHIWGQLTGTQLMVTTISMVATLLSPSIIAVAIAVFFTLLVVFASGMYKTHPSVAVTGCLVAAVSFLAGQSAATGNVVLTEALVVFGGIGGLIVATLWGMLYQSTKKKSLRE
jgi:hypothetical protein